MSITPQQIANAEMQQHAAAQDPAARARLIAGPGTGKSWAIQERVRWLLDQGVSPNSIFVVSFTRASSADLKRRIQRYCTQHGLPNGAEVCVSTLHSLALRALRTANLLAYPTDPSVMDKWELKRILDREFANTSPYTPGRCGHIRENYEAYCGTGHWNPPQYIPPSTPITPAERQDYEQFHHPRTQVYACVLPGEIVHQCIEHMEAGNLDPASLLNMAHLVVDEYQDLNPVDLAFVDGLIDRGVRTFVAGDDDQSIYSFRYASPSGIQSFTRRFPDASHHELTDCFRCTPTVLQAAQGLMSRFASSTRIPKSTNSLYAASDPPVRGLIHRWRLSSHVREATAIARSCANLTQQGISAAEIMILVSNRRLQLDCLEEALSAEEVPYESPSSELYIDSRDGRFAHALLRIVCNSEDYIAHRLILGLRPQVGPSTCNQIAESVVNNGLNFREAFYYPLPSGVFQGRALSALNRARNVCQSIASWTSTDTLGSRENQIADILRDTFGQDEAQTWLATVEEMPQDMMLEELRDYLWADTERERESLLKSVYERLALDVPDSLEAQRVQVMTMHGAKGLDADVVFVPGLEENILPGRKRQPYPGLVNEAARMLYVSGTRARAACILSYAETRLVYGRFASQTPSRFTTTLGGLFTDRDENGLTSIEVTEIEEAVSLL